MNEKFEGLVDHLFKGNIVLPDAIELLEKGMILRAMEVCGGNQCAASKRLGIHRNTLQRKIVVYGLDGGRAKSRRKPVTREARTRKRKVGAA